MPNNTKAISNISLQEVVAAAAQGALRGIDARQVGANELIRSGFTVDIHIICGGRFGWGQQELNPQPLPPRAIGE
jgi:hypothetical protein